MKDNKAVVNVGRGFPAEEGFLSFDKQTGKEASYCWAKPNLHNNAFTLIELLLVVLIIGILAAIAVPQYKKAVLKSRFATIKNLVQSIAEAQEAYYLANGSYIANADKLDINMPTPTSSDITDDQGIYFYPWGYCVLEAGQSRIYCILSNEKNPTDDSLSNRIMSYWVALAHNPSYSGKRACYAYGEDRSSAQDKICQAETGKASADVAVDAFRQWLYK